MGQATVGAGAVTSGAEAGAVAPSTIQAPTALAPAGGNGQRLAYTDDTDDLLRFPTPASAGSPVPFAAASARHEGEISNDVGGVQAFVSTRDQRNGDVYVTGLGGAPTPVRVTCDAATQTHPVVSPSGTLVAYATDVGGRDRIQVADLSALVNSSPELLPTAPCAAIDYRTLAGQRGQNRWPAWLPAAPPTVARPPTLVYSSTRDNPLGDLYLQPVAAASAVRLTSGSLGGGRYVANTQPTAPGAGAVLFTTTAFRPDGSIGEITLAGGSTPRTVRSAWTGADPPQSSTASVDAASRRIAFTSTATNPLGAVQVADSTDDATSPALPLRFDQGTISRVGGGWAPLADPAWGADGALYATARSIGADVRDALARDGSGTKLIAHAQFDNDGTLETLDSARPDYSPDRRKIAYSQRQPGYGEPGRRIVVADADGAHPQPVHDGWADNATNGSTARTDLDVAPVWSPDGKKIAFVRAEYAFVTPGAFTLVAMGVLVVDLGTHAVTTLAATSASDPYLYQDPAWSPDGTRLAMSRTPIPNLGVTVTTASGAPPLTVTVTNNGAGTARDAWVTIARDGTSATLNTPAGCTAPGGQIRCPVGSLAPGQSRTITVTGDVAAGAATDVTARVGAASADADYSDNTASATIRVVINLRSPVALAPTGTTPATPVGILTGDAVRGLVAGPLVTDAPRLWIADPATGQGAPLAPPAADCADPPCALAGRSPSWSPDGTRIVYDNGGQLTIAKLAAGGASILLAPAALTANSVTALTGFASYAPASGGTPTASRAAISAAHDPQWAGDEIYFAGQPAGSPDDSGIYAVAVDGSGLRAVAQAPGPQSEPAIERGADLAVTLSAAPASIDLGATTTLTATVANHGTLGAEAVALVIDLPGGLAPGAAPAGCTLTGNELRCDITFLVPGQPFTVHIDAAGTAPGSQVVKANAASATPDLDVSDNADTATVRVIAPVRRAADLAVTVALAQPTGYVGGPVDATLSVTNNGPATASAATLGLTHNGPMTLAGSPACLSGGSPCPLGDLAPGATRTRTVTLTPTAAGDATLTATVAAATPDPVAANNTDTATLPLKQPTLRLLPGVGPPGRVTLAYGVDFPPGSKVTLAWQPGVTTYAGPFPVAADGTLRASELVVRRDVIGKRLLIATSTSALFAPVKAVMLVVPRTEAPPRFLGRN